jgi:hypothetical protein
MGRNPFALAEFDNRVHSKGFLWSSLELSCELSEDK